jgi:thiamine-monophosphate kinase
MDKDKRSLTPLSELGEFGLIRHLTENIRLKHSGTVKGVGDDAAVFDYSGKLVVVTTDMLAEGIHFDLVYTPLKHLGYKAIAANLSDVYAMNATPRQVLVSLAISGKFALEHVEELYQGIYLACEKYNVDLAGGDTNPSLTGLIISVTALGEVQKEDVVYRNGAKENDLICVSGDLGAAYLGLQILEREKKLFHAHPDLQPKLEAYEYILQRQLKPEPRRDIIEFLQRENLKPTSMIDISDGLSSELMHLCTSSGVGCRVYQEKIPVAEETARVAEELHLEPVTCALNGGEDYELLFTIPLEHYDKVRFREGISVIGHIVPAEEGMHLVTEAGENIPLRAQGWDGISRE